jgi:hypothetical protein
MKCLIWTALLLFPVAAAGQTPPLPGLVQTFDYLPSRDGVALLTGGPSDAGYARDEAAFPFGAFNPHGNGRCWQPRNQTLGAIDPRGSSDVYNGLYSFNVDPEYAGYARYSPFAVVDGNLRIRAQPTASVSPAFAPGVIEINPASNAPYTWVSGVLSSKNCFSQQGGYWEITAKFPPFANGEWPAGWLYPVTDEHPPENDIFEGVGGYDPATVYRATVLAVGQTTQQHMVAASGLSQGFHRYGVGVTDTAITYYLDGVQVGMPVSIAAHPEFQQPFYMLLSMQIGSTLPDWVTAPDRTTPNPSDLLISHVTAWQWPGPIGIKFSALSYIDTLAVGSVVATLSAPSFEDGAAGLTFTKRADPDGMFTVQGDSLLLARAVPATTQSSHEVTIAVTDALGRSRQITETIQVISGTPSQRNYLASQVLTNPFWAGTNAIMPNASTVLETRANGQHILFNASVIPRDAGVATYEAWIEAVASLSRPEIMIQVFDAAYGSQCFAEFSIPNGTIDYGTCIGAFHGTGKSNQLVPYITPLPNGRTRVGFQLVTDAATTGFQFLVDLGTAKDVFSYPGVNADGMLLANPWLYDVDGPASDATHVALGAGRKRR